MADFPDARRRGLNMKSQTGHCYFFRLRWSGLLVRVRTAIRRTRQAGFRPEHKTHVKVIFSNSSAQRLFESE